MKKYFLKCDVSGIQSFIFNVPSKGAAKELKVRSVYVERFSEKCLKSFTDKVETDVVYHGAGNFYAYINSDESTIKNIINEIVQDCIHSDLFPYIAYIEDNDSKIADKMGLVNNKLQKVQLRRPVSHDFLSSEPRKIRDNEIEISSITGVNNQIPRDDNRRPYTFEEIAGFSAGDKKLAALKLDVDNLGELFKGKTREQYKKLSDSLKEFFDSGLLKLIRENGMQNHIYTVFAGGDDCFLIGSWDKILKLAIKMRVRFNEFLKSERAENPDFPEKITFSAGIVIVPQAYPVVRLAEEAEEALARSKNIPGKNSVTCFGKTVSWDEYAVAETIADQLVGFVGFGESKSILSVIQSEEVNPLLKINPTERNGIPKVWHLKYYLRNIKEKNRDKVTYLFDKYTEALLKNYVSKSFNQNPLIYPMGARWAELYLKK